jgi:pimeloyl-ACP methyl ester carboxylesterase
MYQGERLAIDRNGVREFLRMIRKAYVDTPSGQIHYRIAGQQRAHPILFLHQNTSSSSMFEPTMRVLSDRFQCIAIDLPGFGGSYEPKEFQSASELTDMVIEAADCLGMRSFHICGQHTGAGIAAEMGVRLPDRVESVMMIGPLLLREDEKRWYRDNFKGSAQPDASGEYLRETWSYLGEGGAAVDLAMHHEEMWQALRSWRARGMVYGCIWDFPFERFFMDLTCPILLMAAPDDVLYKGFQRSREARPDCAAVELTGSNFEPYLDPEGTAGAIRAFLLRDGDVPVLRD